MSTKKILNLSKAAFCTGLLICTMGTACADNDLGWKNGSDLLAVGLPALAAGAAWDNKTPRA